jgi:DNA-binding NtrC family response regulator
MILWIDKNSFATSLLEKVFKKAEKELYIVSSVDDFSYLVDDLKPQVIVLDEATFLDNEPAFLKQYETSLLMQRIPFIFVDEKQGMSFTVNKIGNIKRPFDPFSIPEQIEMILKTMSLR